MVLPILLLVFASIADFGFLFNAMRSSKRRARRRAFAILPGYATDADTNVHDRVQNYLTSSGLTETTWTSAVIAVAGRRRLGGADHGHRDLSQPFLVHRTVCGFFGGGSSWGQVDLQVSRLCESKVVASVILEVRDGL